MANAIKWIAHRAKQIKRAHPRRYAKWAGYVAEASADYRRSHKAHKAKPAKKRSHKPRRAPRRAPRRRAGSVKTSSRSHTDKNRITANIQVGTTRDYWRDKMILSDLMRLTSELRTLEGAIINCRAKAKKAGHDRDRIAKRFFNSKVKEYIRDKAAIKKQITLKKSMLR